MYLCAGVFVVSHGLFASCDEWGLYSLNGAAAFHCGGFSCSETQAPGVWTLVVVTLGFLELQQWLQPMGFSYSEAWDLPGQRTNPVSSALAEASLITVPPREVL